ncbi:acyclic terpene utilization AtuA family protein [Tsuneonella rigui]|uniref:acyclic terpene utilization AtuA family protein n=1 Tax=Tsuneonella rigui TaxID=1708790 RepID=UPI000F7DC844|nr:acyclic terpene utilization AtuA family protein [Tsuneonella rigui]
MLNKEEHVTVLVPTGSLGAGVRAEEVARGIALGAQVIAADGGSTDSGAAYLAMGKPKYNSGAIKRDLSIIIEAAWPRRIPILIGTCGQAGGDGNLDSVRDIVLEIVREQGIDPKVALLRSELTHDQVRSANDQGRVRPLPPLGPLENATINKCDHIVAALGPEPFIAALEAGADIVLAGRTTDTAVIAAFPLMRGAGDGACWHAGKTAECGAVCTVRDEPGSGVLLRIGRDSFEIEPLSAVNRATTHSISAHMLYENSDPFRLIEPGGILDVSEAEYAQIDPRTVRVTGSVWRPMPYTYKLEGAARHGYQTIMLVGIQDPVVLRDLDAFENRMHAALMSRVHDTIGPAAGDFHISLRIYGWNAVSGIPVENSPPPREVGVLFVATAETQDMATQIAKACNPYFFHMLMPAHREMPSYAFPFSPSYVPRGPVYEFVLNHVLEVDDPLDLVRTEWLDLTAELESA